MAGFVSEPGVPELKKSKDADSGIYVSKKDALESVRQLGFNDPMYVIDGQTILAHFYTSHPPRRGKGASYKKRYPLTADEQEIVSVLSERFTNAA